MISNRHRQVKHAQKEAFIRREFCAAFAQVMQEVPALSGIYVSRIELSPKKGGVAIYFYGVSKSEFEQKLGTLLLYRPALRTAVAQAVDGRRAPELFFKYDDRYEKQSRLEAVLDSLNKDGVSGI